MGPLASIGSCSGKGTSRSPAPEPTIASGQAFFTAAVVPAVSWPSLQTGRPLAFTWMLLSKSMFRVFTAGGMSAVDGADFSVDARRNRGLAVSGQLAREDPSVVPEEEVAGANHVRLGESTRRGEQREHGHDCPGANQMLAHALPP